jgi:hypothetical protein
MCAYRVGGRQVRAVVAGLALVALAAVPAAAQEKQPFKSVNFAIPSTAASSSAIASPAAASAAQAPAASEPSIELGGLVDAYYDWYSTKPSGNAPLRNFDTKHNQFSFAMVELWAAKTPTADSRTGFNLKLNFGPATSEFIHSVDPGGVGILQNVQQAYVSYLAGKVQFDVGEFVTHNGSEVIEAKDDWNYSRGLLFSWAIPYYHAGVRLTYPANDKVTLAGGVVNGWNNVGENNTGKTVWGQIILKPTSAFTFIENYTGGPEQAGNNGDWRHLSDTQAMFTVSPMVSLMGNYDYGRDKLAGADVHWQGVAGYVKFQPTKVVAIIPRAEYYDDADGFTTGVAQKAKEFTLTLELKPADTFIWRIEYRSDFSDVAFFKNDDGAFKKNQHSIGFGLLYNFSTKQ